MYCASSEKSARIMLWNKMKWNESGFRPPLCTYRLNWARRTSWGWWDDWDDTVLQTQDSKFEPWRSEAEHATSRSRRLPTILMLWKLMPIIITTLQCQKAVTAYFSSEHLLSLALQMRNIQSWPGKRLRIDENWLRIDWIDCAHPQCQSYYKPFLVRSVEIPRPPSSQSHYKPSLVKSVEIPRPPSSQSDYKPSLMKSVEIPRPPSSQSHYKPPLVKSAEILRPPSMSITL